MYPTTNDLRRACGALYYYFNKSDPLDSETGAYVAALVHKYARENLRGESPVDPAACQVVDVLGATVYSAPRNDRNRLRDVEAACMEIAAVWPGA